MLVQAGNIWESLLTAMIPLFPYKVRCLLLYLFFLKFFYLLILGVNVTFCQSFGFNSFANNVEKGLAGALLTSFILALLVASSLCLNCCSRTSGLLSIYIFNGSFS
jgi:hypothetical protein